LPNYKDRVRDHQPTSIFHCMDY